LDTWTFAAAFSVEQAVLSKQQILLVLNGIDTIADVIVNGRKVAAVDNYHRWVKAAAVQHAVSTTTCSSRTAAQNGCERCTPARCYAE
jgi:beta-mannosidase